MLTWQTNGGFSVDGSVRVEGDDRAVAIGREASDQGQAGEATIGSKSSDESPHEAARQAGSPDAASLSRAAPPAERSAPCRSRALWALLLARIYEVLPLLCPACRGERIKRAAGDIVGSIATADGR
jgi:hypothetical protein